MVTNPNTLGVFEEQHRARGGDPAHEGRPAVHGRRQHERAGRHRASRRFRRRRDAPQSAQDVFDSARRRRTGRGSGGGEEGAGAVPARAAAASAPARSWPSITTARNPSAACKAFYGNFGVLVRALAYILAHGGPGLRNATMDAVLNANYIRKALEPYYDLPYTSPSMHEVRLQRRPAGQTRRAHRRYRQAPDRLRIPPVHRELPADRARRADDRADRDRKQGRARSSSSTR